LVIFIIVFLYVINDLFSEKATTLLEWCRQFLVVQRRNLQGEIYRLTHENPAHC
jgi:hypothetical protein